MFHCCFFLLQRKKCDRGNATSRLQICVVGGVMVGDCLGLGDREMVEFRTSAVMRKKEFRESKQN